MIQKKLLSAFIFIICLGLLNCKSKKNLCITKNVFFGDNAYKVSGCFVDSFETGEWTYYDEKGGVRERGIFSKGIRNGVWHYPQNTPDSIIDWIGYEKEKLNLKFNIPRLLSMTEDSLDYIKFSNEDSLKLSTIVLSVHPLGNIKIEEYFKVGEEEILDNGWRFTSEKRRVDSENMSFYFNEYFIRTISDSFNILNAYKTTEDGRLFEITCRFSPLSEASARIIFFSLLTNTYYKGQRFINPFDKVVGNVSK